MKYSFPCLQGWAGQKLKEKEVKHKCSKIVKWVTPPIALPFTNSKMIDSLPEKVDTKSFTRLGP